MKAIRCGREYAAQVLDIFNDAIANSTALWEYEPRTLPMMDRWFDAKEAGAFPVVGFVDDRDRLLAFGSYGPFRAFPGYKYTVEDSVYVERSNRGRGLGRLVLEALVEAASQQGYHTMIGAIEANNTASIALHERCGFRFCGTIREAGFKFGGWLDLNFYQRLLGGPAHPVDG